MTTQNVSVVPNGLIHVASDIYKFFLTFNLLICAELIGCFGIAGNVINILNFTKQGLHESVNVTLTALAVSDIGSLLFKLLMNIIVSPFLDYATLPFSLTAVNLPIYFPNGYFIRVSGYITAFAAFERCLCVVLPLKVKTIITRKVAIVVNIGIFIVLSLYLFPIYYVCYLDVKFFPLTNRTLLTFNRRSNAESVYKASWFITDLVLPYVSFFILILCTSFIITVLKAKAKWRHSVTSGNFSKSNSKVGVISSKEKKTSVMLTTVSVIFIACLTPGCAMLTAVGLVKELKADEAYYDLTWFVFSFTFLLETINCSVNSLVYYNMSSRYREIIHTWFPYLRGKT